MLYELNIYASECTDLSTVVSNLASYVV